MLDFYELRRDVDAHLREMGLYSENASMAIMMIIAHESDKGRYWRQIKGPALGLIQMEPATHDDTWRHCDSIKARAMKLGIDCDVMHLEHDLQYNVFMARCRLLMDTSPLPKTEEAMADYLKSYWNSGNGKATAKKYLQAYREWQK